jgi:hypothetical protein
VFDEQSCWRTFVAYRRFPKSPLGQAIGERRLYVDMSI